jgi:hypothetical protein
VDIPQRCGAVKISQPDFIPARRRFRFARVRPVIEWTRWERFLLRFTLGGAALFAVIVLLTLLAGELFVVWAFITA